MAKTKKAAPVAEYRHRTSVSETGQILYDAPVPIRNEADLANYRIQWSDCKTLRFGGSEKVTVYFLAVESREVAEYLWTSINTEHTRQLTERRCFIPGQRKEWIRCPRGISCEKCPHKYDRKPPVISLDGLEEVNYQPEVTASAEDVAFAKLQYHEIRELLNAGDERIAGMLEAKIVHEESVKVIAKRYGLKEARIYQLLDKIKEVGKAYKNK